MKKMILAGTSLFALGNLIICIGYRFLAPVDGLGLPTTPWVRPLANPAVWVGGHCFQWFHWPIWGCQAAGITAMTLLWALIGALAGLVYAKIRSQRRPA